jgi:hypothetical protein
MSLPGVFAPPPAGDRAPVTGQDPVEKRKIFALSGIEFQSFGRPTRGLATILTELSGLLQIESPSSSLHFTTLLLHFKYISHTKHIIYELKSGIIAIIGSPC